MDAILEAKGPWNSDQITTFLRNTTIPIRVSSMGSAGPIVQSLWFVYSDNALWCATQATSVLAKRLKADIRIGFEVAADAPPYQGVRGTGRASLHPELAEKVLRQLIARYQGENETDLSSWLLSRLDKEVAVRIDALSLATWDFSGRMGS